jgi:hypothetical protein
MNELAFSVTDLADESKQLRVGKMLAARYIVYGDVIDMDATLVISLRMADVETGVVVWKDVVTEALGKYSYISAFFAQGIAGALKLAVPETTRTKTAEKKTGDAEAAVAMSNAMDAYDKKDTAGARQELDRARQLDPESELVAAYRRKLSTTSPKYKAQLEPYGPSGNPARLGLIKQDKMYSFISAPMNMSPNEMQPVGDSFLVGEQNLCMRLGIELPLAAAFGLAVEGAFSSFDNKITAPFAFDVSPVTPSGDTYFHDREVSWGGVIGLGYAPADSLSLGVAGHGYLTILYGTGDLPISDRFNFAVDFGAMFSAWDQALVFDSHAVYTTQYEYYFNPRTSKIGQDHLPVIVETTITGALLERSLFCSLKNITDIYWEQRNGAVVRFIPAIEWWPVGFMSVRGGYQHTFLSILDFTKQGHGFFFGATIRLWTFDIDVNFTSRYQPARVLPGFGKDERFLMIGISKNDTFLRR